MLFFNKWIHKINLLSKKMMSEIIKLRLAKIEEQRDDLSTSLEKQNITQPIQISELDPTIQEAIEFMKKLKKEKEN